MARLFNDAQNEYLTIAQGIVTAHPLTMACWFYSDDAANPQDVMALSDGVGDGWALELGGNTVGDPIHAISYDGGGSSYATSTAGYTANTWHHACGVFAAANDRRAFVDGGNKGTNAGVQATAGIDRFYIGQLGNGMFYMSGRLAEAAIWNVALTDAEVAILGAKYSPLFVRPQNLVTHWRLIRDEDQDCVGGYDLTAHNTPSIAAHPPVLYPISPHI